MAKYGKSVAWTVEAPVLVKVTNRSASTRDVSMDASVQAVRLRDVNALFLRRYFGTVPNL